MTAAYIVELHDTQTDAVQYRVQLTSTDAVQGTVKALDHFAGHKKVDRFITTNIANVGDMSPKQFRKNRMRDLLDCAPIGATMTCMVWHIEKATLFQIVIRKAHYDKP